MALIHMLCTHPNWFLIGTAWPPIEGTQEKRTCSDCNLTYLVSH